MKNFILERYHHAPLMQKTSAGNLFWILLLMVGAGLAIFVASLLAPGIAGKESFVPLILLIFSALALAGLLLLALGAFPAASAVTFFDLLVMMGSVAIFSRSGAMEADLFQATVLLFLGLMVLSAIGVGRWLAITWVLSGAAILAYILFFPLEATSSGLTIERWNSEFNPAVIATIYAVGSAAGAVILIQYRRNLRLMQFDQEIIETTNQMLEETVEDRTRALKTILDSSGQGLFTFGADFLVEPDYSVGCRTIFSKEIAGLEADKLLFPQGGDLTNDFRQGLSLFFAGKSRSGVIFDLLETETYVQGRILEVGYKEAGPSKILVVLTDRTLDRQLADRNRADEARRTLVLRALGNKHFFAGLLAEAETLFSTLRSFEETAATPEQSSELLGTIHTFKGNCGFFGFGNTQEVAHDFEYAIQDAQVLGESLDYRDLGLDLKRSFYQELNIITDALGKGWLEEAGGIVIPRVDFDKVAKYVSKKYPSEAKLVDVLEHYRKMPLRDLFSRFPFVAQATAEKLGKRVAPMTVNGGELRVLPDRIEALVDACVHIVNNMVDHGVELPYVREALGKPPEGRLILNLVREAASVVIQFIDDGRGVSFPEVVARAQSLGLLTADATPSPREILQLLFAPGFSTRSEASEVSGRGIGLAAVRLEAERLGGRIEVQSKVDAGTTFEIILPIGVFANRRKTP